MTPEGLCARRTLVPEDSSGGRGHRTGWREGREAWTGEEGREVVKGSRTHRAPPSEDSERRKYWIWGPSFHLMDCRKEMLNPCPCTSQTCDIYSGQIGGTKASRVLNAMLWKDGLGLPRAPLSWGTAAWRLRGRVHMKGRRFRWKGSGTRSWRIPT